MTSRPPPRTRRTRLRPSVSTSRNSMSGKQSQSRSFHLSEMKGLPYIFKERAAAYIMLRLHGLRLQFSPMMCKNKILQVNLMFYPTYPFTTLLLHANRKMLSFHFIIMTACTITTRTFSVIFTVIYLFLLV